MRFTISFAFQIIWVAFLLVPATGFAQISSAPPKGPGKVTGTVIEKASGNPLEYAVVKLTHLPDSNVTGGITDVKGNFEVKDLALGKYYATVSFVGLKSKADTFTLSAANLTRNFPSIALNDVETEEVKITADANLVESGIDKKVYNVGKDISAAGSTAADILQNVPSVTIDMDRNIQLRGSGNVNILINGRPSTLTGQGGLEQLPASMIERIEVVTNPSAKYDPDGMSGIINIITRNNQDQGLSGTASMTAGTGHKYNPSLYLNYRRKKINLYSNLSYQYNRNFQESEFERINIFADTSFSINQLSEGYNINQAYSGSLGLDFNLHPKTTFGGSGIVSYRIQDNVSDIYYDFLDESGALVQNQERNNDQRGTPVATEGGFYFKRIFNKPDHNLAADLSYSRTHNEEDLTAVQQYLTGTILPEYYQHTFADRLNRIITPQINYTRGFKNGHKIEAGVKTIFRHIDQDFFSEHSEAGMGEWVQDTGISNRIVYDDKVMSVYGVYTGALKKLGYSMGLRAEQTLYTVNQITLGEKFDNGYFNLFPTLHLKYKIKEINEAGISYSRRINRPGIEQLNPFPEWRDPYNFMKGNPYLRPEYTHSVELSYRGFIKKLSITASLYYRQTDSAITRFRTLNSEGVATVEFTNITGTRQAGSELILQFEPFKWWNMNLSMNGFYQLSNADNLIEGLSNEGFSGNIRYMGNLKFWKTASAQIIYNYMFPFVMPQGRGGPGNWLDIGLRKEFLKDNRLGVTLRVTDIFNMREFNLRSETADFTGTVRWKRESRIGYVGLSYRFGNGKPQQNQRKSSEEQPPMEGF